MIKSVLDYLDITASAYPDKVGYADENKELTFSVLKAEAERIGNGLLDAVKSHQPVLIYMEKCADCIAAFLGVRYAGGFYVPVDAEMPGARIRHIADTCGAQVMISMRGMTIPEEIRDIHVFRIEDLLAEQVPIDQARLAGIRRRQIDTDPLYAIFTSGSTGMPKGVVVSERSVLNLTEWYTETFSFTSNDVSANQAPFFFDSSVKGIYGVLKTGAAMYIVPHKLFMLPARLVEYLNEKRVTVIAWVPSVLSMIVNFRTFRKVKPEYLRQVLFLGEVMPAKVLNAWKAALPQVRFANLYGPTEATVDCAYYIVDRDFEDGDLIPIGRPCCNTDVFLLDEDNRRIAEDEAGKVGEICVRGTALALGYYNDMEKTAASFTENPLQNAYPERIYRTGDMAEYNERGELVFLARRDNQIKHMGHRIELGEIENALNAVKGIRSGCCLYRKDRDHIVAVYEGKGDAASLSVMLGRAIPHYMIPNEYYKVESMPLNANGKIDRAKLREEYGGKA